MRFRDTKIFGLFTFNKDFTSTQMVTRKIDKNLLEQTLLLQKLLYFKLFHFLKHIQSKKSKVKKKNHLISQ